MTQHGTGNELLITVILLILLGFTALLIADLIGAINVLG